jgi:proteic killer suppression protein
MKIRSVAHKGLRRFMAADDPSGLPAAFVEKIRNMLSFLQEMESVEELRHISGWRAHRLTGDRKGTWSLVVSRNRRLTFRIDEAEGEIIALNFEDYH